MEGRANERRRSHPQRGDAELPHPRRAHQAARALVGQWGAVALAAGFAYLLLLVSPLPWRVNVSLIVVFGGGPMVLLLLREQGALSAAALVSAVCRWRAKPALLLAVDPEQPPQRRRRAARRGARRDRAGRARRGAALA